MVRLGQGVDRTGRLADEALERTFAAIDEYAALIAAHDVARIRFCATSATRDAANAEVFAAGVEARLGVAPEVISGAEEAALAFDGAVRNLRTPPAEPVLVVDIGGGSTELILGSGRARTPRTRWTSGRCGCTSATCTPTRRPPTRSRPASPTSTPTSTPAPSTRRPPPPWSGSRGPCLSVVAGVLDLPAYDRDAIDQAVVPVADVHAFVDRLVAMPLAERLALPWLHPGRADVIDAGALILSRVLRRTPLEVMVVSEADILDGIAWSVAG